MRQMLALLLVLVTGSPLLAQCTPPQGRAWIEVSNAGDERDTLWFGFDPAGSYGINASLCEFDLPPVPPANIPEARFVNIPGREGLDSPEGLGLGAYQDYRRLASGTRDTFQFRFQPGLPGYPVRLRWPPEAMVLLHRDSVILCDGFGGVLHRVRMDKDSIVTITQSALSRMLIFLYGPSAPDAEQPDSTKP